jgi:hypothetical protein
MPNHCQNQLIVTGTPEELERFRLHAQGVWPWRHMDGCDDNVGLLTFTKFIPAPLEMINDYQQKGINWCANVLGSKWGAYDVELEQDPGQLRYMFDTAWSPMSDAVLLAMSVQFPTLVFDLVFDESGMEFEGQRGAAGGVLSDGWDGRGVEYRGILNGPPEHDDDEEEPK